ncbi:SDR family oxidoreductase [Pseudoflavonifractor sp. 524-17]|uniref:SDR family NAD(P)-dependent oxidoreductase n=1 Tax=Pseudoflavonifractor sp. 524-17 TaxID=2304577 RepID=UPI00137B80BD|nr:SDR family oxidoreductase [Pseudoflavonifractor sp. 524-17]NCE65980.1 SDR family oxidoreductase [Pseudoflavonifractor sp. 524-17]
MKTALITGSTRGIGWALGLELLSRGCEVVFNYAKDEDGALQLRAELEGLGYGARCQIIRAGLSSLAGAHSLVEEMNPRFKRLDYLVLNAGTTWRGSLADLKIQDWEQVMNTNVTVPLFLTQMCAPRMAQGGCILFIGSILGQYPHALPIPYGTSKAAVYYLAEGEAGRDPRLH